MRLPPALVALALAACQPAAIAPGAPVAATSPLAHVRVLALNDFHGNLEPPHGHDGGARGEGGAAYLVARVKKLAAESPAATLIVSAGDLTGASPLVSNLFKDEPTVLVMNLLGLDYEGVGNHDFDRGLAELTRLQNGSPPGFAGAHYRYLAANVFGRDGKPVFPAYGIKQLDGVKVAVVGMTLEGTPTVTTKEAIAGLRFADEAATANALLPELRAQGVAAVVLLIHQGGFQDEGGSYDTCVGLKGEILPVLKALDPAFRVVVTAHTHQAYDCDVDGRRVTSAGSFGRFVTAIDLTIDRAKNQLVEVHAHNVPVTHDIPPNPDTAALVAAYEARAASVTQKVVGWQRGSLTRDPRTAHSPSCETPLGDLIADAQLAATRDQGAVVAFMNPGGIRTDLTPEVQGGASPIRYGAAFEVQPFGNQLVTVTLTGAELQGLLEAQFTRDRPRVLSPSKGLAYAYRYDAASKKAVVDPASVRLDGKPLDPRGTYRVTVNSFLAGGGDGFTVLRDAPDRASGPLDIDAFVSYLTRTATEGAPVSAGALDRVAGDGCR